MQRAGVSIALFVLTPPAVSFFLLPAFGLLNVQGVTVNTYLYFAAFYAPALLLAFLFFRIGKRAPWSYSIRYPWIYWIVAATAAAYVFTALADIITYHQVFSRGISGAWLHSAGAGPRDSPQGAIALIFSGAPVVLLGMSLLDEGGHGSSRWPRLLAAGLFALSMLCMLFLSARNSAFISLVYLSVLWFVSRPPGWRVTRRTTTSPAWVVPALTGLGVLLLAFSFYIFVERPLAVRGSIDAALTYFFANYQVTPGVPIPDNSFLKTLYFAFAQFEFYLTHPPGYFSKYLSENFCPAGGGAYSFYGLFRIIDFVVGTNFVQNSQDALLNKGLYLSLPGYLFLDFCWSAIGIGWLFLAVTAASIFLLYKGRTRFVFLAAGMLTMFVFAPFYSIGATGNGLSILLASIALTIVPPFERNNTNRTGE